MFRIGQGYDVHRLVKGRKLVLGGVEIPSEYGLDGHSDADVLLHAICDAMLGALSLGDIGQHFPDTDPRYKNVSSLELLKATDDVIRKQGFTVSNIDSTVVLESPKLATYIPQIRERIAAEIGLLPESVSVKATTSEKIGFVGKLEGASAHAIVMLKKS